MKFTRRETLVMAAAATLAGATAGWSSAASAADGDQIDLLKLMAPAGIPDKVLGSPDAKVTFIEYASPTCPHCARFANTILADFEAKYVTTGKVKFIMRPFARNTLDAAIFMLAEAAAVASNGPATPAAPAATDMSSSAESSSEAPAAPAAAPTEWSQAAVEAYHNVIATFFKTQDTWGVSDKPKDAILAIAVQLGFTEQTFNDALKNTDLYTKIGVMAKQAVDDFGLEGTPTFYINGKTLTGEKTMDDLAKEIDPLLA